MKKTLIAILLGVSALFISCTKSNSKNESSISVVTTTFPVYDAVRAAGKNLIGNQINLKLLVKPGTEVHSFDPSPADIISIQNSDLFIYVGGESDEWVEKIIKSSGKDLKSTAVSLMNYVKTVDEPEFDDESEEADHHHEEHEDHDEENEHEADEHIWTSPENEILIMKAVSEALINAAEKKSKPELKKQIIENSENYIGQINELIKTTRAILDSKAEPFLLMADRFPFVYFADFYGLNYDAAFSGCSTAVEANTKTISRLIDTVNEKKLPAVFYIELGNHKIADSIAENTGVKTILLQSCQNVTKTDFDNGETWLSLMKNNAEALNAGLR